MSESSLPSHLTSLAFRLSRVDELADDLARCVFDYVRTADAVEIDERRDSGVAEWYIASIDPVPPIVSLLFSDAINQLRSTLDNALVLEIEESRQARLEPIALRAAKFLIDDDEDRYKRTLAKIVKHLPELAVTEPLGKAMWELQPFRPVEKIRHMTVRTDDQEPGPHHLRVLQGYSNADKHHRLRVSSVHNAFIRSATGAADIQWSRTWEEGQVIARTRIGELDVIEVAPYLSIPRPLSEEQVPPGAELNELHRYVAEVALVKLLGLTSMQTFAPQVDIRSKKLTDDERIATAGTQYAHSRAAPIFGAAAAEMYDAQSNDPLAGVRLPRFYEQWMEQHDDSDPNG